MENILYFIPPSLSGLTETFINFEFVDCVWSGNSGTSEAMVEFAHNNECDRTRSDVYNINAFNLVMSDNEFTANNYGDYGLLSVYCLVLSIETTEFESNENVLMSVTDSDVLMSDSTVSAHSGQSTKYNIYLEQLTNIYFDSIRFEHNEQSMLNTVSENSLVIANSQITNHTGNFMNIETHSSGPYFTLLSNTDFNDSSSYGLSFINIENNNVWNQSIKFENVVFANNIGTIFDSVTALPTNVSLECASESDTYTTDGIIEFENVLLSANEVTDSYLFKFKLHRIKLTNIRFENNECNNYDCFVAEHSSLLLIGSTFVANLATNEHNIFHTYFTQLCVTDMTVTNDESNAFIYVSMNNVSNDRIMITDARIDAANLKYLICV
ncbi:MAG: hypothetical protein GY928_35760, partial [Colwellia sp.]|nr:hypothetical protein [Colwellia sp.]